MKTHYFTFGSNHTDSAGNSLGQCFVPVVVEDSDLNEENEYDERLAARQKMISARDDEWSMCYTSAEEAGVEKWGLVERSLESVAFDRQAMKREAIRASLSCYRGQWERAIARLDGFEEIMMRLPDGIIQLCGVSDEWLQISNPSREQVETILGILNAGRWEKIVCPNDATKIDYKGTVDNVTVVIYAATPPPSCRIIEREENVPAHKKIVRELVCT